MTGEINLQRAMHGRSVPSNEKWGKQQRLCHLARGHLPPNIYSKACLLHPQRPPWCMSSLVLVILRAKPLDATGHCPPSCRCGLPLMRSVAAIGTLGWGLCRRKSQQLAYISAVYTTTCSWVYMHHALHRMILPCAISPHDTSVHM